MLPEEGWMLSSQYVCVSLVPSLFLIIGIGVIGGCIGRRENHPLKTWCLPLFLWKVCCLRLRDKQIPYTFGFLTGLWGCYNKPASFKTRFTCLDSSKRCLKNRGLELVPLAQAWLQPPAQSRPPCSGGTHKWQGEMDETYETMIYCHKFKKLGAYTDRWVLKYNVLW